LDHGRVDYCNPPPKTIADNFNTDNYLDIARFDGRKLEVYLMISGGYPTVPQLVKEFDKPIASLKMNGSKWSKYRRLTAVFTDGSEQVLPYSGGSIVIDGNESNVSLDFPPRTISEDEFQLQWESDEFPYGVVDLAIGDLDNDGIEELVTWWKEYENADNAWILIYKCVGDDELELYMQEPFDNDIGNPPEISHLFITDLDQNGQKELIYSYNKMYIWEFEAPGVYHRWNSNFSLPWVVTDAKVSDVDNDSIPEISVNCTSPSHPDPTIYLIKEFAYKTTEFDSLYIFSNIVGISQDWPDYCFALDDFDNDGAIDIVGGYFGYVTSYDPQWFTFYRLDPVYQGNFTLNWVNAGIPLSCANPIIADFDSDGDNELFAGGLYPNGGSAFLWESTGFTSGYASWLDSSLFFGPNETTFGLVNGNPTTASIVNDYFDTDVYVFSYQSSGMSLYWESGIFSPLSFMFPLFYDIDNDQKQNLFFGVITVGDSIRWVMDWEVSPTGIELKPNPKSPSEFILKTCFPNPFNSTTIIPFALNKPGEVEMSVYDISGRLVYHWEEGNLSPGYYEIDWHAEAETSGIYIFYLRSGEEVQSRKGILMK
ncbi:MAG: T9SS type A sorting domain-containing protein, partial [bacterium]